MAEEFVGYVTTSALLGGIYKATMHEETGRFARYYRAGPVGGFGELFTREHQAFRTWSSALARAEQMRANKIASLRKQLARLESLTFEEPK